MPLRSGDEEQARSEITAKVFEIWTRAVERADVKEHQDFYTYGGNHFLAPVMIDSINHEMGVELRVSDLESARTITNLSELIYIQRNRVDCSTVVPLRNIHGSLPPLFLIHGIGGNVLGFYSLAKQLEEDQPVYGVQAQALLKDREAVLKLEEMAAQYVRDMRAVCPEGPYHLLGFSFGGLVAYEIAQQLSRQGAKVGLLAMLDTRQPDRMGGSIAGGSIAQRLWLRLRLMYLHTARRKGRLRYLWRRLRERRQRVNYLLAARRGVSVISSTVRNVLEINRVAASSYKVRAYPGRVTLFRALDDPQERDLPRDLDWGRFAGEGITIHSLPGDHGQILHEAGMSVLAQQLTSALHEAGMTAGMAEESKSPNRAVERVTMEF